MEMIMALDKRPAKTPSQRQLDAWLREWRKALRLQDWNVKIECKREKDMEFAACHGLCNYSTSLKNATITIRDSLDFKDGGGWPEDVEATVVHELLHLHFAPIHISKGLGNTLQEQAIEVLAQCLVALKRKGAAMAKGRGKKGAAAAGSPPLAKPEPKLGKSKGGGKSKKCC
jgi:hypothetical protein